MLNNVDVLIGEEVPLVASPDASNPEAVALIAGDQMFSYKDVLRSIDNDE